MTRKFATRALVVLVVVAAGNWQMARAAEFRCSNGSLERRIELRDFDGAGGAACEVRYWRDAAVPDSGRVLWHAQQDADFCAAKARELITRLEAGGWTCTAGEQPAAPERAQAQVPDRAPVAGTPAPAAPPGTAAVGRQEPPALEPAPPSPPAPARTAASVPGAPIVPPSAHPAAPLLDQVLKATLHSAEQLYGGAFQAEHAAFGDLDGDGDEDAAVLITYEVGRDDYVQYLVAYLFNGEVFQSIATRNVGGRFLEARRAVLRAISDSRILVELETSAGGAGRSGTRPTGFVLDRGQLVEVPDPDASGAERTSQAEPSSPG